MAVGPVPAAPPCPRQAHSPGDALLYALPQSPSCPECSAALGVMGTEEIVEATKEWLEKAVIGLNLCPFAKPIQNRIRYAFSDAETPEALQRDLAEELRILAAADPDEIETTLLIHPRVLTDFLDYNDFLDVADDTLADLE